MALDKMVGAKVASRAFDLRIDLGQSVPKILTRLVSFILDFWKSVLPLSCLPPPGLALSCLLSS